MQFNSYIFILLYLPAFIAGYYLLNKVNIRIGKAFLILMSAVFYIYGGWDIALIFAASIIINYLISAAIVRMPGAKGILLTIDIAANIAVLFYFKYFNFFLQTMNDVMGKSFELQHIILPLGISFFTFQQIMYVVCVAKGEITDTNCADYLAYILYFPKIIMGPITAPKDLIAQINDPSLKQIDSAHLAQGIKIFCFGLFKKLVIADTFASAVTWGFGNADAATSMDWILVTLFYTFQIYFDFSGYSDMAVGVSRMLNITLPMNFDSPYKAVSIRDFWKRWHMSLTKFLTRHIYIPLGGNQKGTFRTYLNTMIVFVVSGLWHGSNWTFVLWGVLHGLFSIADRVFEKAEKRVFTPVRWMVTFFAVNLLWLLFRADSITQWRDILIKMFAFQDMSISKGLINVFNLPETAFIYQTLHLTGLNSSVRGFSMLLFILASFVICLIPENNYKKLKYNNWLTMIAAALVFVWSFLCLSSESVFVYNNF